MTANAKRFRVVVLGVAEGQRLSQSELIGSITEYYPLRPDARLALEAGRSAVVQVAESEHQARRAATRLLKLGAEIRIEPESGGLDLMDFDSVDLSASDGEPELDLAAPDHGPMSDFAQESPTLPPPAQMQQPMLVDRPPTDLPPSAAATRRLRTPTPQTGPARRPEPPQPDAGEDAQEREPAAPALEEAVEGGSSAQLVRCPAHGLLYDATTSAGCSRCLGPGAEQTFRLAPELRKRPRLWLTLGLGLGLLLGAVPAALYAQSVKSGTLYERRIEAEAIRRGRVSSEHYTHEYAKAQQKTAVVRSRGIALSALIWIGISALLMLLWYRFV